MNILVDVDDTLTSFVEERNNLIVNYIKDNKLPYKILDLNCTKSAKVADWPIDECCKFWKEVGTIAQLNCPTQRDCQSVLSKLKQKGHQIIIVSARPDIYYPAEMYTKMWLDKNNIPYDKIIIGKQDKKQSMIDNDIKLVIDDSTQTINYATELGLDSFIVSTKENSNFKAPDKCVRVFSWKDIEKLLKSRNIL